MDIQAIVTGICQRYNISEEERNLIIWNTGVDFAGQFKEGHKMMQERLYWEVFKRLFTEDDELVLKVEGETLPDYGLIKADLVLDDGFKALFCRTYHGLKRPAQAKRQAEELDQWRKRLIASIGGWMQLSGKEGGIEAIKAIACRAAGKSDFNDIPKGKLVSLYNAFLQKQNDLQTVKNME